MPRQTNKPQANNRVEIFADEYISVMNICPMALTLTSEPFGRGRKVDFQKFGDTRQVAYSDLVRMMDNHPNFLEKGYFYILDQRVIQKHGLIQIYEKILNKEKLDKIFSMGDSSLELYKQASESQREFIDRVLIRKVRDGEQVDLNLISKIEKVYGSKIMEKANQAREMMEDIEE